MDFSNLSPHIRFINIFNYYPKEPEFVLGYDYRIFYITDGSLFLNFKDSEHLLEKNSLVMIPPETAYKLSAVDECGCDILCINFDCIKGDPTVESVHPDNSSNFDKSRVFEKDRIPELERTIVISDASSVSERILDIFTEFQKRELGYRQKGESILCGILISCLRRSLTPVKKEVRLAASVKQYLLEHISEPCDIETIGEVFHYHPNYINRVFKENIGTTIHSFLITERIESAKELLITSNLTLEKIAVKCGFKTLAHFSQCFKNVCGISPGTFRKRSESVII